MAEKKKRVVCAMSGGVDSSVAAAILKKQGYDVVGVFMKLSSFAEATEDKFTPSDAATAARAVANKLGIPFYAINLQKEFKKAVVDYYIKEYENGRTPNPCVVCNRDIKGEILMRKALEMEADFLATGHYARIKSQNANRKSQSDNVKSKINYELHQAKDKTKDQTYFLWTLTQKQLSRMLFPIGDYTKSEVRKMAAKWKLPTAKRKESQGICFIPDRDVSGFLKRYAKKLTDPGPIYEMGGKKIGTHDGLIGYTIGQRERLGLGGPRAYYVVKLNVDDNSLVVGDEEDLYRKELIATSLNWIQPISDFPPRIAHRGETGRLPISDLGGRIRYGHPINNCQLKIRSHKQVKVIFDKPQRAITPGQSIVFYHGEEVLGGGIIKGVV